MSDVLIDDIATGSADSSATGDNEVLVSYDDLIVVVNDIKNILTDNFDNSDNSVSMVEHSIDDIYVVLSDFKTIGSAILVMILVSITISVFRKLFDQF